MASIEFLSQCLIVFHPVFYFDLSFQFRCKNHRCVSRRQRCNGQDNCGDNSDEEGCNTTTRPCLKSSKLHFILALLKNMSNIRLDLHNNYYSNKTIHLFFIFLVRILLFFIKAVQFG